MNNSKKNKEIEKIKLIPDTVLQLLMALDSSTFNHSLRLRNLTEDFCKFMTDNGEDGYSGDMLPSAALVHDIGKLYITPRILDKPTGFTALERNMINTHPYASYMLLKDNGVDETICQIALYHHGLTPIILGTETPKLINESIKIHAMEIHTLDMYEALTTDRPYRRRYPDYIALHIIKEDPTTSLDVINFIEDVIMGINKHELDIVI